MTVTDGESIRGRDQDDIMNEPRRLSFWNWNPSVCYGYWTYSWHDGLECVQFGAAAAAEEEGSDPTEDWEDEDVFEDWEDEDVFDPLNRVDKAGRPIP